MRFLGCLKRVLALAATAVFIAAAVGAAEVEKNAGNRLAALALPTGPRADWQQWDSFFTNVVKKLNEDFPAELRDQLGETFLDARYRLVQALGAGGSDPVPQLFAEAWNGLSPLLKKAIPGAAQQTASQYTSFIGAMDAASTVSGLGQSLGLFGITPDVLNGAARLLGAGGADPLEYSTAVDAGLRALLGFTDSLPGPRPSPLLEQSRLRPLLDKASAAARFLAARPALAAEADADRLNQWLPEKDEVHDYLLEVRQLLAETSDRVLSK